VNYIKIYNTFIQHLKNTTPLERLISRNPHKYIY